jgi:hypothetical protein
MNTTNNQAVRPKVDRQGQVGEVTARRGRLAQMGAKRIATSIKIMT